MWTRLSTKERETQQLQEAHLLSLFSTFARRSFRSASAQNRPSPAAKSWRLSLPKAPLLHQENPCHGHTVMQRVALGSPGSLLGRTSCSQRQHTLPHPCGTRAQGLCAASLAARVSPNKSHLPFTPPRASGPRFERHQPNEVIAKWWNVRVTGRSLYK